jgi:hypothetical protein
MNWLSALKLVPHLGKLIPPGYLFIVVVAALSLSHGAAYIKGREAGLEKYYELKSEVSAAQKQAEADAVLARAARERIDRETADGWAAAVAWHRAHPRIVRVLPGAGCLPEAGSLSAAPGGLDAPAAESGLGATVLTTEQCEARINGAVLCAAQVIWLQHHIKQQHEARR